METRVLFAIYVLCKLSKASLAEGFGITSSIIFVLRAVIASWTTSIAYDFSCAWRILLLPKFKLGYFHP